jgi:opacity protein-like surface antigen
MKRSTLLLSLVIATLAAVPAMAATAPKPASGTKSAKPASGTTSAKPAAQPAAKPAGGGSDIGFKSIGGALGYVSPEDLDGAFSIGAFADLGMITPDIGLEARLDWWSHSEEEPAAFTEFNVQDIILGARAKYYFEVDGANWQPFAGAGLAMHFLSAEMTTSVPGFPSISDDASDTKLGLDIGGGIKMPVNPRADFLAESWYSIVSDVSQFALRVGMTYHLK